MNTEEYYMMDAQEKDYWWHQGKLFLVDELIKQYFPNKKNLKILEIGSGSGHVLLFVKKYGDVTGYDMSEIAIELSKKKGLKDVHVQDINNLDVTDHENNYDLILALDVLEHIRDDIGALRKIRKMLKPGGYFFGAVPAYKFLWSTHDEALHHVRRYHSVELSQKVKDAGFVIEKCTHFVAAFFFPIAVVRLLNNVFMRTAYPTSHYFALPKLINNFFAKVIALEAHVIKHIDMLFGTTLVVVGRKDEN